MLVEREIRNRLRRFKAAFSNYPKLRPQYASKINTNLEVLKIVREEGFEIDASSVGEIILALLADFKPYEITFTNLYKTDQDILFAAKVGVQAITIDSLEEIHRINTVGQKMGKKIKVFFRINPLIRFLGYSTHHHQYGVPITSAKEGIDTILKSRYLELVGIHFHGSYSVDPKNYFLAAKRVMKLARYCIDNRAKIRFIDLGGGFPMATGNKKVFQPEDMGKKFTRYFLHLVQKYQIPMPWLVFEPGKFIVGNAGVGLVKIVSVKRIGRKRRVVTDGSTYAFLPDVIVYHAYYDILPATNMNKRRIGTYDIAGCTCDCIDYLGKTRWLPKLEEHDLLAVMDCGAYSHVMASNFNTLKRASMVMIKEDGSTKLIRRRDRYSEMFAPELDVLKVADPNELKEFYDLHRINIDKLWREQERKKAAKKNENGH